MEIKFTTDNYPWSIDGLKSCIKDNKLKGVKILVENDTAAAVYIPNYQASIVLGGMSDWCISQHKCSWKQYVSDKNNVQMFFFDFSKKPLSELTLVGATYTNENKFGVMCAFTRGNHPLHEIVKKKDDQKALYEEIISENFSWPQMALIDESINNIFNGLKPVKEELNENHSYEPVTPMESSTESYAPMPWIGEDEYWDPWDEELFWEPDYSYR